MPYPELFLWWAIAISWSIIFLTVVSVYVFLSNGKRRRGERQGKINVIRLVVSFVFVWVLFSLLALYIFSIDVGSSVLFATGNIVVEVFLVAYLLKNRTA